MGACGGNEEEGDVEEQDGVRVAWSSLSWSCSVQSSTHLVGVFRHRFRCIRT